MASANKTRRGSPEAIAKRRAARALNQAFSEEAGPAMDGRTLKRKKRLLRELKEGQNGKPLKALDVLQHTNELLRLGESISSLRKLKPMTPAPPPMTDEVVATIRETQASYAFDPRAWKVLGVDPSILNGVVNGNGKSHSEPARGAKMRSKRATSNSQSARPRRKRRS